MTSPSFLAGRTVVRSHVQQAIARPVASRGGAPREAAGRAIASRGPRWNTSPRWCGINEQVHEISNNEAF